MQTVGLDDLNLILHWRNQISVRQWMFNNLEISESEHVSWFMSMLIDPTKIYWKVVNDQIPVGAIFLTEISKELKSCNWGMYLGVAELRGKGIAQAASFLSFRYAFNVLGMDVIKCEVFEQNETALGLYESVGYVRTGANVNVVKRGNELLSVITLELSRDEWFEREPKVLERLEEKGVSIRG